MEARDRLTNLGFLAAAAVVWLLVWSVLNTRDPLVDPGAGFVGAALIGLAAGLSLVPVFWLAVFARHRRIAYQGDWTRAIRRAAWVGIIVTVLVVLRLQGVLEWPIALFMIVLALVAEFDALRGTLTRRAARTRYARVLPVHAVPTPMETRPLPSLTAVIPAEPHADQKARLATAVDAARGEILDLSHRIHADPETAFEEHRAAAAVAEILARHGFAVEFPAGSLATAIRAVRPGARGGAGPRIGILAEYDALPGLGHGCGHNTMAASGVGAAIALASMADELAGEIVFLGTPAEERGSGKQIMIDDGLMAGLDAALMYHPCDRDHVESWPLASEDVDVVFHGLQAHASSDPWMGRNALDAMILLFSSVGLWRQQLRPTARVHGIIREGGTAANIIPERTTAWFMIRSDDEAYYETMRDRFRALCDAAATATGTTVEVTFSGRASTMNNNPVLAERFRANMAAYGIADQGDDENAGSTDMANVSWVCPTIHPDLSIAPEGTPGHSILFRDAAISPRADETTLLAATLVAQTAYELFADPELVASAWRAFEASRP